MLNTKYSILMLAAISLPAAAQQTTEVALLQNPYGRQHVTCLNGDWHTIIDQQEIGYYDYRHNETPWGFFLDAHQQSPSDLVEYNFDTAPTLSVPGDWNSQDPSLLFYEGTIWYRQKFDWTPSDRRTLLYLGAANYDSVVYVNGRKQGRHIGGFTPFNYDITDALHPGENTLVVKVDNTRHREAVPTDIFDWWNYGGITRDVLLVTVPDTYITDYGIGLDKNDPSMISGYVRLNQPQAGIETDLDLSELGLSCTVVSDSTGTGAFCVPAPSALGLWCPEDPRLYDLTLTCGDETITDQVGFRTIATRGKQILLNGKPTFLRGVSIHEEAPGEGAGRAYSVEHARTLLGWAKDMGCNYVRLAHYPHNEHIVREAERMGIMVWSEIPCYWTIDWTNPDTYENARRQLHDMITRDHNRANIVIWSIANETPHSPERDIFLRRQAEYARELDPTRLISMAMEVTSADNYHNRLSDNLHDCVDVVSFNQYVGWYRDTNDAPLMTWEVPYDKPVIVSEFGGGARAGFHADADVRFSEEFQERLYVENLKMLDKIDGLAGLSPWILKDFRSPRRPLPGVQDWYNRKGLVSDKGERKRAFSVMRDYYTKRVND